MRERIDNFFKDTWWFIEYRMVWPVWAFLTRRCQQCGLKRPSHKMDCSQPYKEEKHA